MLFINEYKVYVTIFCVILFITEECYACFSENHVYSIPLKAGSPFYRKCSCTDENHSIKSLKWLDINGQEIPTIGPGTVQNVYTEYEDHSINLHIFSVSKAISGTYQCVTENNGRKYALAYKIDAYEPLYFIDTDVNQTAIKGTDSLVRCEARSETGPSVSWHKEKNGMLIAINEKYNITSEGLIIHNVTEEDKGIYKCTAVDYYTGDNDDRYIKVEVMTLPFIKELKYQDNIISDQITTVVDDFLSIDCIAEGVPPPEYFWNKTSEMNSFGNSNNTAWRQKLNSIIFNSVRAADEGTYECIATNKAGEDRKQIKIKVLLPPSIIEFSNITVAEGSNAELICKAIGKPTPNLKIMPSDEHDVRATTYNQDQSEIMLNTQKLIFNQINRSHQGYYICNASNEVDSVVVKTYLNVLYRPHFKNYSELIWGWNGITANLSCEHDSNPPSNITWRYHGNEIPTEEQIEVNKMILSVLNNEQKTYMPLQINRKILYGNYECIAKNDFGEAKKTITLKEAFVPPAIRAVTIEKLFAKSVTFLIIGPENVEGPPVLGFLSEYDELQNYDITNIHINRTWSTDRPYKLEKLKPNTTYRIRFAATNKVGAGVWSEYLEFDTPKKTAPDAPSWSDKIYLVANDSGVEQLKWNAPDDNGDPIDYYVLRYCQMRNRTTEEEFCKEKQLPLITELDLKWLEANTSYYLELLAHNTVGNSTTVSAYITTSARTYSLLSAGAIIGIAVIIVLVAILLLDLLLFCWKRQGIIASCCFKKDKKRKESDVHTRDRKGLLKDNGEAVDDTLKSPNNGHKEYQYNKNTGAITGKHSAV